MFRVVGGTLEDADAAMARYAAGDDGAFGEVYDRLAPRLYGFLYRQTHDPARTEDLLQQTFLQIHAARGRFIPGAEVLPWALAIARRLTIDGFRRGGREIPIGDGHGDGADGGAPEPVADGGAADEIVHADWLAARMEKELAKLPPRQRAAFELIRIEGLSNAQAAEVLGASVTAVKLLFHRANLALRTCLGEL